MTIVENYRGRLLNAKNWNFEILAPLMKENRRTCMKTNRNKNNKSQRSNNKVAYGTVRDGNWPVIKVYRVEEYKASVN